MGIGFAIPVQMAQRIMAQLVEYGQVSRGLLGLQAQTLTPELAQAFGIPNQPGAVITQVEADSAAERAGLVASDVVIEANGSPIQSAMDLRNAAGMARVGDKFKIVFLRDGEKKSLVVPVAKPTVTAVEGAEVDERLSGAVLEIPNAERDSEQAKGIAILAVRENTTAWRVGLRAGDRILMVNKKPVQTIEELVRNVRLKKIQMLLNIQRGGEILFLLIR
ncbi:MAG: PDZ domain-containing protein [Magnetococcus sp. DMHC-6]